MVFAIGIAVAIVAFLFVTARSLFVRAGISLSNSIFRIFLAVHMCLLIMSVSTFGLARYNLYWRGYRSTSIIIITTAFSGLLCVWLNKRKTFLLLTFSVFIETMLSIILVCDVVIGYHENLYYNDGRYRLENTDRFIMAHPSLPDLFVKKGLFEKEYMLRYQYPPYILSIMQVKSIIIKEITTDSISIAFTHTSGSLKNPLIINVGITR